MNDFHNPILHNLNEVLWTTLHVSIVHYLIYALREDVVSETSLREPTGQMINIELYDDI